MRTNWKRRREDWSDYKAVFTHALSTTADMIGPAVILGGVAFGFLVIVELLVPGNQIQWLANAGRDGWGILVCVVWLLFLTVLWQAASILAQRDALDEAKRRLRKLQPEDD